MKTFAKRVAELERSTGNLELASFSDAELEAMLVDSLREIDCSAELVQAVTSRDWSRAVRLLEAMP